LLAVIGEFDDAAQEHRISPVLSPQGAGLSPGLLIGHIEGESVLHEHFTLEMLHLKKCSGLVKRSVTRPARLA
jgi:hypothetical protein